MKFWLIALAICAVVILPLLIALLRKRPTATPAAAYDMQVYHDQLKEVDRDLARGVVSAEDADRTRLEISRRLLEADKTVQSATEGATAPRAVSYGAALFGVLLVMGGGLALYDQLGAPGYPDLPLQVRKDSAKVNHESRPSQTEAEEEVADLPGLSNPDPRLMELVERLRAVVQARPDDQRGLELLARNEAALGNFKAAYAAQSKLITLRGEAASGDDFAGLADMMILAAGGYVSPQAEAALTQALRRDNQNGTARYYSGLMFAQTGRPDLAFQFWRDLLENGPQDAPWVPLIRAQIGPLARQAGVNYTPPAALPGPSADDMAATADMSPEERQAMIEGMVEGLADRLANQGGSADEWARLVMALGNLGQVERAAAIWREAQQVFAQAPAGELDKIRAAAQRAGVAGVLPE